MRRRDLFALFGAALAWPLCSARAAERIAGDRLPWRHFARSECPVHCGVSRRIERNRLHRGKKRDDRIPLGGDDFDRLPALADDLVDRNVDLIVAQRPRFSNRGETRDLDIPILFTAVGDPIAAGLVTSLARPGGNVTASAFSFVELIPKRLDCCASWFQKPRRSRFW